MAGSDPPQVDLPSRSLQLMPLANVKDLEHHAAHACSLRPELNTVCQHAATSLPASKLPCPPWTSVDYCVWLWSWSWPGPCTGPAQDGCKKVRWEKKTSGGMQEVRNSKSPSCFKRNSSGRAVHFLPPFQSAAHELQRPGGAGPRRAW